MLASSCAVRAGGHFWGARILPGADAADQAVAQEDVGGLHRGFAAHAGGQLVPVPLHEPLPLDGLRAHCEEPLLPPRHTFASCADVCAPRCRNRQGMSELSNVLAEMLAGPSVQRRAWLFKSQKRQVRTERAIIYYLLQ